MTPRIRLLAILLLRAAIIAEGATFVWLFLAIVRSDQQGVPIYSNEHPWLSLPLCVAFILVFGLWSLVYARERREIRGLR
jgi:hypothetical protein